MKNEMNTNPNEGQSQTQNARILRHLQQGGSITSLESLEMFGCLRLSARIKDLRDRGHDIQSKTITLSNGKRVSQYFMEDRNGAL